MSQCSVKIKSSINNILEMFTHEILQHFSIRVINTFDVSKESLEKILQEIGFKMYLPNTAKKCKYVSHRKKCDEIVESGTMCSKHQKYEFKEKCVFKLGDDSECGAYVDNTELFEVETSDYCNQILCSKHAKTELRYLENNKLLVSSKNEVFDSSSDRPPIIVDSEEE